MAFWHPTCCLRLHGPLLSVAVIKAHHLTPYWVIKLDPSWMVSQAVDAIVQGACIIWLTLGLSPDVWSESCVAGMHSALWFAMCIRISNPVGVIQCLFSIDLFISDACMAASAAVNHLRARALISLPSGAGSPFELRCSQAVSFAPTPLQPYSLLSPLCLLVFLSPLEPCAFPMHRHQWGSLPQLPSSSYVSSSSSLFNFLKEDALPKRSIHFETDRLPSLMPRHLMTEPFPLMDGHSLFPPRTPSNMAEPPSIQGRSMLSSIRRPKVAFPRSHFIMLIGGCVKCAFIVGGCWLKAAGCSALHFAMICLCKWADGWVQHSCGSASESKSMRNIPPVASRILASAMNSGMHRASIVACWPPLCVVTSTSMNSLTQAWFRYTSLSLPSVISS